MSAKRRHASLCPPPSIVRSTYGRPLRLLANLLSLLLITVVLVASPSAALAAPAPASLSTTTRDSISTLLQSLQTRSSDSDVRYLKNNVWVDGTPTCFRCTLGPSVLAAARGRDSVSSNDKLVKLSITTMDLAIRNHQRSDGAFGPAGQGESGYDIQTVMFANELAWTYLTLGPRLDFVHRTAWKKSLTRSADWLVRNGNLTYYVNGNINLALAMNMDLTYRITGVTRFRTAAKTALSFTLNPPQGRWSGFGLQYSKTPTKSDGSDGAGYLAEKGSDKPGFDPVYTLFQADMAAMWYVMTGSSTAKRLTNLFYNQLAPRVRTSDWTIDVSGGSRRGAPGERWAFQTPALAVLAQKGGRIDLKKHVQPQVTALLQDFQLASRYPNPGLSYSFASQLAPIYLVVTSAG